MLTSFYMDWVASGLITDLSEGDFSWTSTKFLSGLGVVGTWTLIGLGLIYDKGIALKREVTQRDKTIDRLWDIIGEKDSQLNAALLGNQVAARGLHKFGEAAESIAKEGT